MSKRKDPADVVVQYFLDQPLTAAKQLLAVCAGIVRRAEAAANPPAPRRVKSKPRPKPKVDAQPQPEAQVETPPAA